MNDKDAAGGPEEWRPGRRWRPINERRIGGRLPGAQPPNRIPVPPHPTGTLSGAAGGAVVPDAIPSHVELDTLRMLLARHEPSDEYVCRCGQPLGEETGLCYYGRQAQKRLYEAMLDRSAASDDEG
jgi:hypothetical protein